MGRKMINITVNCARCGHPFNQRQPNGNLNRHLKYCGRSCAMQNKRQGVKHSVEWNRKISEALRGEKGKNWRGGITPWQKTERRKPEYKQWRIAVFTRDSYTCVLCGTRGGELNADHIKSWIKYPELRLDLDNGRTLCVPCHKQTPTYAKNLKYQE